MSLNHFGCKSVNLNNIIVVNLLSFNFVQIH
jgi:hypothetical protein